MEFYREEGLRGETDFGARSRASSNAAVDLISDSTVLELTFKLAPATSARFASFDLYVDGVLTDHRFTEDLSCESVRFKLPGGTHRATLFLPWSTETRIRGLILGDGAACEPKSDFAQAE